MTFQALERGIPAKGPLSLTVYTISPDGGSITNTASMQTAANGILTMTITGVSGGTIPYIVTGPNDPSPTNGIDMNVNMYMRTLAADAELNALPPTWQNVYSQVLAPCMDNWLMLNEPVQVRNFAHIIKRVTDPGNFEQYRFMPITRDMTAGKRSLLYRFPDATDDQIGTTELAAPARPVSRSQAMRRPR